MTRKKSLGAPTAQLPQSASSKVRTSSCVPSKARTVVTRLEMRPRAACSIQSEISGQRRVRSSAEARDDGPWLVSARPVVRARLPIDTVPAVYGDADGLSAVTEPGVLSKICGCWYVLKVEQPGIVGQAENTREGRMSSRACPCAFGPIKKNIMDSKMTRTSYTCARVEHVRIPTVVMLFVKKATIAVLSSKRGSTDGW